jgi:hypothetical protein
LKWKINTTPENYIILGNYLPTIINQYRSYLLAKKIGYQGLIYREAVENLDSAKSIMKKILFAGFNALNALKKK